MITTILHNYHISFINYEKAIQCLFLRNAVTCSSLVAFLIIQIRQTQRPLIQPPLRSAVTSSSLVAFLYYVNNTNIRRARHVPEQTYRRISLWRNMSCSSLHHIHTKRHKLHSRISDDLPKDQFEKEYVAVFPL